MRSPESPACPEAGCFLPRLSELETSGSAFTSTRPCSCVCPNIAFETYTHLKEWRISSVCRHARPWNCVRVANLKLTAPSLELTTSSRRRIPQSVVSPLPRFREYVRYRFRVSPVPRFRVATTGTRILANTRIMCNTVQVPIQAVVTHHTVRVRYSYTSLFIFGQGFGLRPNVRTPSARSCRYDVANSTSKVCGSSARSVVITNTSIFNFRPLS